MLRRVSLALATLAVTAPAGFATSLPKVLTQEKPSFQVRPAMISYTGDGTGIVGGLDGTSVHSLGRLEWKKYNHKVGLAVGLVWLDNCTPDCASGRFSPSRVRVRVSEPKGGHFRLLTLRYRYRGRHYLDRRVAHYYSGGAGVPGYWNYAICGINYAPKC